jgi:transcriptional regulator with XRE-family HTH domain
MRGFCSCTMPATGPTPSLRSPTTPRRFARAWKRSRTSGNSPRPSLNTDPSSSVHQARKELGARLRQLRRAAGLTGKQLAAATGQHFTRISRIENGGQAPTPRNIQDWCIACGRADHIPDLLATAESIESAYLEWARQSRAGMRRLGDLHSIATYQRTTTFRIHEPIVMPGIFQTEAYIRNMLAFWYTFLDAPDDADATVAMKTQRTAIALTPAKRILVVLGEQALRTRRGTSAEHADQLKHLLALMRLPYVSVGIIPANRPRYAIATTGFWIFDNNAVALETPTAAIKVTRPHEIALYASMFEKLQTEAAYGHDARRIIADMLRRAADRFSMTRQDAVSVWASDRPTSSRSRSDPAGRQARQVLAIALSVASNRRIRLPAATAPLWHRASRTRARGSRSTTSVAGGLDALASTTGGCHGREDPGAHNVRSVGAAAGHDRHVCRMVTSRRRDRWRRRVPR